MSVIEFRIFDDFGKEYLISYDSTLTIREFILDFLNKIQYKVRYGEVENTKEDFEFRFNGKLLNSKKFIDEKIGNIIGVKKHVIIQFKPIRNIIVDVKSFDPSEASKYMTKEYQPGYKNLSYRKVNSGLNIQIKCNNEGCLAKNTIIYIPLGYVEEWHLQSIICEYCKHKVDPINFWIKDCNYVIKFDQEGERCIKGIADGFGNFVTFNDSKPIYFLRFKANER
jgi:hypothetical protein